MIGKEPYAEAAGTGTLREKGEQTVRNMLSQLFYGRNGMDQLNGVLLVGAVASWAGSLMVHRVGIAYLFHSLAMLLAAIAIVRALSRNIGRRQQENQKFLAMLGQGKDRRDSWSARMEQRRQYKVFKCPSCGIKLRVPRGKGRIKVTCRQCGATFEEKS